MKELTREQALQRLDNPENLFNILHKNDFSDPNRYKNGNKNGENGKFSQETREIAVGLSKEIGNNEAAELVGCRPETLSQWKKGITSNGNHNNIESSRPKQSMVEVNREAASEKAAERILQSLNLMDDTKLRACNAVELATVAARLSSVGVKNGVVSGARVNVNVYTPQVRTEQQFQTVEVLCEQT